jgi:hypothetical protein
MAGYAHKSLSLFLNYWHCCRNLQDRWVGCFDTVSVRVVELQFLEKCYLVIHLVVTIHQPRVPAMC